MKTKVIPFVFQLATTYYLFKGIVEASGCGGVRNENQGTITSPEYPYYYPNNMDCHWQIYVQRGYAIMVTFHDFKLQGKYGQFKCDDYVVMLDVVSKKNVFHQKCGEQNPFSRLSTCNIVNITFHTDRGGKAIGFNMTWNTRKSENSLCKIQTTTETTTITTTTTTITTTTTPATTTTTTTTRVSAPSIPFSKRNSTQTNSTSRLKTAKAEVKSSSERAFFNSETLVICVIVVLALLLVLTFAVICGCLFLHHMNTILKRDRASNLEVKQTLEELKIMLSGSYMQLDFTRSNQVQSSRSAYTDLTSNSVEIEYETPT